MAKKKPKAAKKKPEVKINAGLRCLNSIKKLKLECGYQRFTYLERMVDDLYSKYIEVLSLIDEQTFKTIRPKRKR